MPRQLLPSHLRPVLEHSAKGGQQQWLLEWGCDTTPLDTAWHHVRNLCSAWGLRRHSQMPWGIKTIPSGWHFADAHTYASWSMGAVSPDPQQLRQCRDAQQELQPNRASSKPAEALIVTKPTSYFIGATGKGSAVKPRGSRVGRQAHQQWRIVGACHTVPCQHLHILQGVLHETTTWKKKWKNNTSAPNAALVAAPAMSTRHESNKQKKHEALGICAIIWAAVKTLSSCLKHGIAFFDHSFFWWYFWR